MRNGWAARIGLATLLCVSASGGWAAAADRLERVIVVERHGVRAPTKPPEAYAAFAAAPWPVWPVPPGDLTPHGAEALRVMAAGIAAHYAALGFLPHGSPAAGDVFVWADSADQRTRASGTAIAQGLAPDCGIAMQSLPAGTEDPLFHGAKLCPADPAGMGAVLAARLRQVLAHDRKRRDAALAALRDVLGPGRDRLDKPDTVRMTKTGAKLDGALATGATLSENLLLEYAQGFPADRVGWGRATSEKIAAVMPLHGLASDIERRTPLLARRNGSLLAAQLRTLIAGAPATKGEAPVPKTARMVFLVGHDTNLANLGGMLGLRWRLPGQPDATAPDTALAFEVWQQADGARIVRVRLFYQTLDELRDAAISARGEPETTLPTGACAQGCGVAAFGRNIARAIDRRCVGN